MLNKMIYKYWFNNDLHIFVFFMNVLEVTKVFGFKICILIPVYGAGGFHMEGRLSLGRFIQLGSNLKAWPAIKLKVFRLTFIPWGF